MSIERLAGAEWQRDAVLIDFQRPQEIEDVSLSEEEIKPTHLVQGRVLAGKEIVDWTLEIPEELRYDGIATFVPGYLGIKQSSRKPRNALAQEGIAALSYSPAREGGESRLASFKDPQQLHVITLRTIAADLRLRRQEIARTTPNANRIDVDRKLMFLHSMGGLAGPRYAALEPGAVEMLIGYATVGFGHPTIEELAVDVPKGVIDSTRHELLPAFWDGAIQINLRNLKDIIRYYSRLRVIFEGLSCLRDDVSDEVGKLDDRGIPYHYLGFGRDILVRPDPKIAEVVTSFDVMKTYGHLAPQVKSRKVAKKITELAQLPLAA